MNGDRLRAARTVLLREAKTLQEAARTLDGEFLVFADVLWAASVGRSRICLTGVGKSLDVAAKVAGTMNSTGTRCYVLDATRALHGDLGAISEDDAILAFSHSGNTLELVRLFHHLKGRVSWRLVLTGNRGGELGRWADAVLVYPDLGEACPYGLSPSTSAVAMLGLGDALAFDLMTRRGFTRRDFAVNHPGGALGVATADDRAVRSSS